MGGKGRESGQVTYISLSALDDVELDQGLGETNCNVSRKEWEIQMMPDLAMGFCFFFLSAVILCL
jgi:hypothetical protein